MIDWGCVSTGRMILGSEVAAVDSSPISFLNGPTVSISESAMVTGRFQRFPTEKDSAP